MKLRKLFFIILITCAIIPVILLSGLFFSSSYIRDKKLIIANLDTASKIYANNIDTFFNTRKADASITINGPVLQSFIYDHISGKPSSQEKINTILSVFDARLKSTPSLRAIILVDTDGKILLHTNRSRIGQTTQIPGLTFQEICNSEGNKPYLISDVFDLKIAFDEPLFTLAIPIITQKHFEGAMIFMISTNYLNDLVAQKGFFSTFKSASITVLDSSGRIAATNNPYLKGLVRLKKIAEDDNFKERIAGIHNAQNSSGIIEYKIAGVDRIAYYSNIADTGWIILCSVNSSELLQPLYSYMKWNISFVFILLLVVIIIFFKVIKHFTGPIDRLIDTIHRIHGGDRNARFEYDKKDEFGEIADAFNQLVNAAHLILDNERYKSAILLDKSSHDQTTGILNKATTEELISECISGYGKHGYHALIIFDIDVFKHINDTYGHQTGDVTLVKIAEGLREIFRDTDIIGRVGGDEFMVFLKNIKSIDTLKEKAEEIVMMSHLVGKSIEKLDRLSVSVGCCRYPQDGLSFEELYAAADKALYVTKENGKDGYTVLNSSI